MIYYQCDECWQIEQDVDWVTQQDSKICKHCNKKDKHKSWPSPEIRELFETIAKYEKTDSFEYGLIASVFVSAALELMLERLLFTMAIEGMWHEDVEHLIVYLINSNQGRAKRIQLYKRLGYDSFDKEASDIGYKLFLKHWTEIAEIRNKSVHGKLTEGTKLKSSLVEITISEALAVFSKLHNKYNVYSIPYQVATEKIKDIVVTEKIKIFEEERRKDMEKLRRWKEQVLDEPDLSDEE